MKKLLNYFLLQRSKTVNQVVLGGKRPAEDLEVKPFWMYFLPHYLFLFLSVTYGNWSVPMLSEVKF